jgi:hypothetical protein
MQSEMEKLFGGSNQRFAKAKECQAILSPYRFQVRRLRSDLQVPRKNVMNVLFKEMM